VFVTVIVFVNCVFVNCVLCIFSFIVLLNILLYFCEYQIKIVHISACSFHLFGNPVVGSVYKIHLPPRWHKIPLTFGVVRQGFVFKQRCVPNLVMLCCMCLKFFFVCVFGVSLFLALIAASCCGGNIVEIRDGFTFRGV